MDESILMAAIRAAKQAASLCVSGVTVSAPAGTKSNKNHRGASQASMIEEEDMDEEDESDDDQDGGKAHPKVVPKSKAKGKSKSKATTKIASSILKRRLELRPHGCSRCRNKPGCFPSC